jgi:hypothetical protein
MAVAVLLVVTMSLALVVGAVMLFSRSRRASAPELDATASRADTQRYLAAHWTMVEQTARQSGMTDEEIARVRENVLGIHG